MILKVSCVGFLMQYILIDILPAYLQINISNNAMDRKLIGLSAREIIWGESVSMIIQKPIFGFGPMHFANIKSAIANHPHQLFLQILSEWGILFFMLFLFLFKKIIFSLVKELKYFSRVKDDEQKIIYVCLTAAIFSSLMQSMVDGVFVMPYTEVIFIFMAAWLASIYFGKNFEIEEGYPMAHRWGVNLIIVFFSFFLIFPFIKNSPTYIGKSQDNFYNNVGDYMPRFWLNGGF